MTLTMAGCAVHPLPADVTGLDTVAIVKKVRCEAGLAIEAKAEELLDAQPDQYDRALAADLRAHPKKFIDFQPSRLRSEKDRAFYYSYINSGIALQFTFDITEDSRDAVQVDLVRVLTADTVSLGLGANDQRTRHNIRTFIVSDTFGRLLNDTASCQPDGPNLVYPITGSVGLADVISTFIDLNRDFILKTDKPQAPVLADTLTFTTVIGASVKPGATFKSAGHELHILDASLTSSATRTDVHQLNVGLSFVPINPPASGRLGALPFGGATPLKSVLSKTDTKDAETRAIEAIGQQRIDTFYNRFNTLSQ